MKKREKPTTVPGMVEELERIGVKGITTPPFGIPNWPKGVVVDGKLGYRRYRVPVMGTDGLMKWQSGVKRISFSILGDGMIKFQFHGIRLPHFIYWHAHHQSKKNFACGVHEVYSGELDAPGRVACLILFERFRGDIFAHIVEHLEQYAPVHNEVLAAAAKAFEPFVPYAVADELSK